jgi:hypothetical protein
MPLAAERRVFDGPHEGGKRVHVRLAGAVVGLVSALYTAQTWAEAEVPEKVGACELKANPAVYNHRLIEVTGFISHGFEDFSLFDPGCLPWIGVWLEYGGTAKSGTIYCCGPTASRHRPKPLVVDKIPVPLERDDQFLRFDDLIQQHPSILLHATLVGRFFAGRKVVRGEGELWTGYGHMGCCSLLAIQRVRQVDPVDRNDIDYDPYPDEPSIDRVGCGFRELTDLMRMDQWITAQREAEDRQPWAFDDSGRVASEALARLAGSAAVSAVGPTATRRAPARVVYQWPAQSDRSSYMVVVSRPYLASYYARDSARVAWIAIAVYQSSCERRE